jgi:hypothetical protein
VQRLAEVPGLGGGFGATDHCRSGCRGSDFPCSQESRLVGRACSGEEESAGVNRSKRSPEGQPANASHSQSVRQCCRQTPGARREFPAKEIVDAGFLELVRYGIRRANDPTIQDSLRVVDAVLKVETPYGPSWRRYTMTGTGSEMMAGPTRLGARDGHGHYYNSGGTRSLRNPCTGYASAFTEHSSYIDVSVFCLLSKLQPVNSESLLQIWIFDLDSFRILYVDLKRLE